MLLHPLLPFIVENNNSRNKANTSVMSPTCGLQDISCRYPPTIITKDSNTLRYFLSFLRSIEKPHKDDKSPKIPFRANTLLYSKNFSVLTHVSFWTIKKQERWWTYLRPRFVPFFGLSPSIPTTNRLVRWVGGRVRLWRTYSNPNAYDLSETCNESFYFWPLRLSVYTFPATTEPFVHPTWRLGEKCI